MSHTTELETGNIRKLLWSFAIPAIIATAASSLYNVIDRMFIGQGVGAIALAGLGITLPVMNLATALGTLVGAGSGTLTSIKMGEKKLNDAQQILSNALILNIIISILFSVLALIFLDPILYLFGADEETIPYARDFIQIILIGNPITHIFFGLNSIMRASGYPTKAMVSVLMTVGCNLILAPLFLFVFHWGIRGAATATVISQFIGMIWVLAHFISKKNYIHFTKSAMRLDTSLIGSVFAIGLAPFVIHVCSSLVAILMNWRLIEYGGNLSVAAFGIVNSILALIITIVLGLAHGMQPIVGFNYGAKQMDRTMATYKLAVKWGSMVSIVGFAAVQLMPEYIARAFTDNQEVIRLTARAMRMCCGMVFIVGFQVVTSNFFQSIGKAKVSIFLALSRQIIFLIPFIILLPPVFGLDGAWWAMPCADLCAAIVTAMMLWIFLRRMKREE